MADSLPTERAWHFLCHRRLLRDGRPAPHPGDPLIHDGDIVMCRSGLHASIRLLDALSFAPGLPLTLVECGEIVTRHPDKIVCRRRTILHEWYMDEFIAIVGQWYGDVVLRLAELPEVNADIRDMAQQAVRAKECWAGGGGQLLSLDILVNKMRRTIHNRCGFIEKEFDPADVAVYKMALGLQSFNSLLCYVPINNLIEWRSAVKTQRVGHEFYSDLSIRYYWNARRRLSRDLEQRFLASRGLA